MNQNLCSSAMTRVVLLREANATAAAVLVAHRMLKLRRKLSPALSTAIDADGERGLDQ